MPIQTDWADADECILRMHFEGEWTSEDLKAKLLKLHNLHQANTSKTHHVIIDFSESPILPVRAMQQLYNFTRQIGSLRKEYGFVIFVGASRLLRAVGHLLSQGFPNPARNVYNVNTYEEALKLIEDSTSRTHASGQELRARLHETLPPTSDPEETQPSTNPHNQDLPH
jgi:hypothetical protein